MRLWFVRHGETMANRDRIRVGQTDIPLTDLGREQAKAIRPILARIPFDRVYASDLSRTIETQSLALPGRTPITTPLLREYDIGSLAGRPIVNPDLPDDEYIRRTRDFTAYGGENPAMICDRVRKFLRMAEADPCDNGAVFAHNGTLGAMLQVVLGADIDQNAANSTNCAIHVFEYKNGKWTLLSWNYMAELK